MRWWDFVLLTMLYVVGSLAGLVAIMGTYIGTMALMEGGYSAPIEVWIVLMLGLLLMAKARKLI